jgi:hypothetical protein
VLIVCPLVYKSIFLDFPLTKKFVGTVHNHALMTVF